jgi:asparagine synthase (glutamine-hydrolysing)
MCGIAGFVSTRPDAELSASLRHLTDAIRHRGPDDEGFFEAPEVGLGMRRLSIVDLAGGHQPIGNEDGSVQVVFNGEIYNYVELRAQLQARGHTLRTEGDTETLVHLYEDHGTDMLKYLRGMFAFAIWDARKKQLFVARDRLGKKPLFYRAQNGSLRFCSELAPLIDSRELDPEALLAYLIFGYVPNPRTMVRGIVKLPPAHYLLWRNGELRIERYWSRPERQSGGWKEARQSYEETVEMVRDKLDESIRIRLRSDVPLGLLLSGGLDSNAILARLTRGLGVPIRTFTIAFEEKAYDESDLARISARHFGTEHHQWLGRTDLLKFLPDVVRHYGEPFADKSALPALLVSQMTRREVKVALNGDGGDEAFGGYAKYRAAAGGTWSRFLPRAAKAAWSRASMYGGALGGSKLSRNLRRAVLPETLSLFSTEFFAGHHLGSIATPELRQAADTVLAPLAAEFWTGVAGPVDRMLAWDQSHYLADDLLVKMDIASMARSLEVRSPFLDQELVEMCAKLPVEYKVNSRQGKLILREIVAKDLPPELLSAPKRGFSVPLDQWFRGSARESIAAGVLPIHAGLSPYLRQSAVETLLREHVERRANHAQRLWALWVLNEWARTFL